jgi:hypothetical protein
MLIEDRGGRSKELQMWAIVAVAGLLALSVVVFYCAGRAILKNETEVLRLPPAKRK